MIINDKLVKANPQPSADTLAPADSRLQSAFEQQMEQASYREQRVNDVTRQQTEPKSLDNRSSHTAAFSPEQKKQQDANSAQPARGLPDAQNKFAENKHSQPQDNAAKVKSDSTSTQDKQGAAQSSTEDSSAKVIDTAGKALGQTDETKASIPKQERTEATEQTHHSKVTQPDSATKLEQHTHTKAEPVQRAILTNQQTNLDAEALQKLTSTAELQTLSKAEPDQRAIQTNLQTNLDAEVLQKPTSTAELQTLTKAEPDQRAIPTNQQTNFDAKVLQKSASTAELQTLTQAEPAQKADAATKLAEVTKQIENPKLHTEMKGESVHLSKTQTTESADITTELDSQTDSKPSVIQAANSDNVAAMTSALEQGHSSTTQQTTFASQQVAASSQTAQGLKDLQNQLNGAAVEGPAHSLTTDTPLAGALSAENKTFNINKDASTSKDLLLGKKQQAQSSLSANELKQLTEKLTKATQADEPLAQLKTNNLATPLGTPQANHINLGDRILEQIDRRGMDSEQIQTLLNKMVTGVESLKQQGLSQSKIQLQLPQLGQMEIVLHKTDNTLQVIILSQPGAQQLMQAARAELFERLQQQLPEQELELSFTDGQSDSEQGSRNQRSIYEELEEIR